MFGDEIQRNNELYEEYKKMKSETKQKNINIRITECLMSNTIDSVLAYDAIDEDILTKNGFVRTGTISLCNEIVGVYRNPVNKKTFTIEIGDDVEHPSNFIEKVNNEIIKKSDKHYLYNWK